MWFHTFCQNRIVAQWIMGLTVVGICSFANAQPEPVGVWEFDDSNNLTKATIGSDLILMGGDHAAAGGISGNDGAVEVPVGTYYLAAHGIAPNGGGAYVNQYTLVFDINLPTLGVWYSFYNTDYANSNDGDAFIDPEGNIGVGATGYSQSAIPAGEWHRVVISVNLASGSINYFLNGELIQAGSGQGLDGRFALYSTNDVDNPWIVLLGDENGDDATLLVSLIAMYDVPLNLLEAADLGSAGDPLEIQQHEIVPPQKPVIEAISPESPQGLDDIVLTASPFLSPSGNGHKQSIWELSFDPSFINQDDQAILRSETTTTQLTGYTVVNSLIPFNTTVYARVKYVDTVDASSEFSDPFSFQLAEPAGLKVIYSEDFESAEINGVPEGWTPVTLTEDGSGSAQDMDYFNPQLRGWSVQTEELLRQLVYYPSYEGDTASVNQIGIPIVENQFMYADSGNYAAFSFLYEAHLLSPIYNLSGVTDVMISFNSNYVQNQDNIAALEYSTDGGSFNDAYEVTGTWKPVAYFMDVADIVYLEDGQIDVIETMEKTADGTEYLYLDFTLARDFVDDLQQLAPHIYPRVDDGYKDGKRFEKFRLPDADGRSQVRFRWTYMGTWSWYWGFDNLKIYGDDGTPINDWSLY